MNDLDTINLKSKLKLKAGWHDVQSGQDMYNKSVQKPPLHDQAASRSKKPGNH